MLKSYISTVKLALIQGVIHQKTSAVPQLEYLFQYFYNFYSSSKRVEVKIKDEDKIEACAVAPTFFSKTSSRQPGRENQVCYCMAYRGSRLMKRPTAKCEWHSINLDCISYTSQRCYIDANNLYYVVGAFLADTFTFSMVRNMEQLEICEHRIAQFFEIE